jgi:hypothetical protein
VSTKLGQAQRALRKRPFREERGEDSPHALQRTRRGGGTEEEEKKGRKGRKEEMD